MSFPDGSRLSRSLQPVLGKLAQDSMNVKTPPFGFALQQGLVNQIVKHAQTRPGYLLHGPSVETAVKYRHVGKDGLFFFGEQVP